MTTLTRIDDDDDQKSMGSIWVWFRSGFRLVVVVVLIDLGSCGGGVLVFDLGSIGGSGGLGRFGFVFNLGLSWWGFGSGEGVGDGGLVVMMKDWRLIGGWDVD
ncbi:hypothetical protein Q3G72_016946 [Acer saccharum]|nr:hypothetical protein Q3G72_016946 [Acer saccharum]